MRRCFNQHGGDKKEQVTEEQGCCHKTRGLTWKEADVRLLLEIMREETILFSLDNAKTPKEKRAAYINMQVKLQNKGKKFDSTVANRSLQRKLIYFWY